MSTTATPPFTTESIEAVGEDIRWNGHGYLGERAYLARHHRAMADAVLLDAANGHGWNAEEFFQWVNSRSGRHFANAATTADDAEMLRRLCERWDLFNVERLMAELV